MDDEGVKVMMVGVGKVVGIGGECMEGNEDVGVNEMMVMVMEGDEMGIVMMREIVVVELENVVVM